MATPSFPHIRFPHIWDDRRGSVAVMVAVLALPMIGAIGLATDVSFWFMEQHRLQIAADAAAHVAAMQLGNTSLQTGSPSAFTTLVTNEAKVATGGGALIGTLNAPTITIASDYSSITVTLTGKADAFFANALFTTPVTVSATATAGVLPAPPCVLALSPSAAKAINVNNSGKITASGCPVFSDSSASDAIYVDSGTINAKAVSAHGGFTRSSSGSNSVSPTPVTGATAQADPVASQYTLPTAGSCTYSNITYTSNNNGQPYTLQPGTYCGNTTIGGNGSSDTFAPGTYIFTGNLTISGANITQASGVTFIMLPPVSGGNAGTFSYQNNSSATLTAPTTGPMTGLLFWQACPSGKTAGTNVNGLVDFNNGGTLTASGTIYVPCGTLQIENNTQIKPSGSSSLGAVAASITVIGSAGLQAVNPSTSGGGLVALTQ